MAKDYKIVNLTIVGIFVLIFILNSLYSTSLFTKDLLEKEIKNYNLSFYDDFESYDENSEILDASPENLGKWQDKGTITAWTNIKDWTTIERLDLKLIDSSGKEIILNGVENIKAPRENNLIKSDDEFKDYYFNCGQSINKWEDYMLVDGVNFLFWEYNSSQPIDMSNVVSWEVYNGEDKIEVYDVVIHDGLCKNINSLNGRWYTPNGLPQYGVWWVKDSNLIMKNVEQEQYPSNGDHTRILSNYGTPENFILKAKFKVINLQEKSFFNSLINPNNRGIGNNTYFRIGWDFDDKYDPGHDQTSIYNSFEYGYLGLQRVFPVERYFVQSYEPNQINEEGKTKFSFKNNKEYIIYAKVEGNFVEVEVYELKLLYNKKVAETSYSFKKERPNDKYPFFVETTGDVQIVLDSIEVWEPLKLN